MLLKELRPDGSLRVSKEHQGETMTEQNHRPLMDVNAIVARARKGIMPEIRAQEPVYGNFDSGEDFFSAQCKVAQARQEFSMLPANIKKRFRQDVGELIDFLDDPENRDEAISLGLIDIDSPGVPAATESRPDGPVEPPAEPEAA